MKLKSNTSEVDVLENSLPSRSRSGGQHYYQSQRESYFAAGKRNILDRVTTERALSGSVTLAKSSAMEACSSAVRRARSAAKAAPILSIPDMFGAAIHTKCVKSPSVLTSSTARP